MQIHFCFNISISLSKLKLEFIKVKSQNFFEMSTKKKVQFDRRKKVKKFNKDDDEMNSGSDVDDDENSDVESGTKKSKHSLDSDEEDNADKYKLLNREFMNG